MIANFTCDLAFSLGERENLDVELLRSKIPNCVKVIKTDVALDKKGIDYIAFLDGGAKINIDAKTRRKGASRNWIDKQDPLLALEIWSVCPNEQVPKGKAGWTCSRKTNVDMILYTFDKEDTTQFYFIPFQLLRMALQNNYHWWKTKWKPRRQLNQGYESEAMFVPASVVLNAIYSEMQGNIYF